MYPILASFGPITLYTYGLLLAVAFLVTTWRASAAARHWPAPPAPIVADEIMSFCATVMIGGLIGARGFYVLSNFEVFRLYPTEILAFWHGGLVWYGGLLGGVGAALWYVRAHALSARQVFDQIAPFIALGHAIGRVGCFFNGCCYGVPTTAWWGVNFPGHQHPMVPTQLIESALLLALWVGLRRLQRPAILRRPGRVFAVYMLVYAVSRFVIEFWRGDQQRMTSDLTLPQYISVGFALAAIGWLVMQRMNHGTDVPSGRRTS